MFFTFAIKLSGNNFELGSDILSYLDLVQLFQISVLLSNFCRASDFIVCKFKQRLSSTPN